MHRRIAAHARLECHLRLVGRIESPEPGNRQRSLDAIAAFASQGHAAGVSVGYETEAFGAAERKHAVACDAGLRIGIGFGRSNIGKRRPWADCDSADAFLRIENHRHAGGTAANRNREGDNYQKRLFQHEPPQDGVGGGISRHATGRQAGKGCNRYGNDRWPLNLGTITALTASRVRSAG
ncbi:protein of unknown function [Aminobacter niigataensis]|nr:protein of unknown function [Aminobacter niigataensis]